MGLKRAAISVFWDQYLESPIYITLTNKAGEYLFSEIQLIDSKLRKLRTEALVITRTKEEP